MAELASLVLHLRAQHTDEVPVWLGRAAHAWFLESLEHINPELSRIVHDENGLKPFTVSNPLPLQSRELTEIKRDTLYMLHLTTLHADLTQLTLHALIPRWLDEGVRLHAQPFTVEQIVSDEAIDEWAGTATYADLFHKYASAARHLARRLTFQFVAPTAFNKTGAQSVPLPMPELVFGSLIDRWLRFSTVALHPDLKQFVIENAAISYHRIQSRRVSFDRAARGNVIGFTGEVTFQITSGDSFWLGQLHMLAAFARYSGVGVRTTMGLGQVRAYVRQDQPNLQATEQVTEEYIAHAEH